MKTSRYFHLAKESVIDLRAKLLIQLNNRTHSATVDGMESVFRTDSRNELWRAKTLGGERDVLESILFDIDSEDVVFDVGANIGMFACFLAQRATETVAFEPEPTNRHRLRKNLELNELTGQCVISEVGLTNENGTESLAIASENTAEAAHSLAAANQDQRKIKIRSARADTLITHDLLPQPDVVKIDVEGAEGLVLDGFGERLTDCRVIYVEVHPEILPEFETDAAGIRDRLASHGFSVTKLSDRDSEYHLRAINEQM